MLQPVTLTYRNAIPTGMLVDLYVREDQMQIRGSNPLSGFSGVGELGDVSTSQLESLAATGAATTVGLLSALQVGLFAVPGVGAAISAGISVALEIAQFFKGCGQTCIQTTQWANQIEPTLLKNLNAYLSSPIRTTSMQQAALNNFDTVFAVLVKACNNPQLGTAGQRCISDRQAGACQWKASPNGWTQNTDGTCTYTPAGPNGSGSMCWNWYRGYRWPIESDPCVMPDSVLQQATGAGSTMTVTPGATAQPNTNNLPSSASLLSSIPAPVLIGVGLLTLISLIGGMD